MMIKQLFRSWNARNYMLLGCFIACIVGILIKFDYKFEFKPESEKRFVLEPFPWPSTLPLRNCHGSTRQGRRSEQETRKYRIRDQILYQEDRIGCHTNLKIPLFGRHDVRMGAVGVFDGHNGISASDVASRFLMQKFMLYLNNSIEPYSDLKEILKSSLVLAFNEIDTKYSEFASRLHRKAGSTAVVALVYDKHVLVANVGDSKAFLCYQKKISQEDGTVFLGGLRAKELTKDHNAYRLEEKARVEAAGGEFTFIHNYVPLLMGHFPITRAIGAVPMKRYGIIADPEVTDWLSLTSEDEFLVLASRGMFERSTPQAVCDFLNEVEDLSDPTSLAHQLTDKAYLEGSNDNLAVILVPLGSGDIL